MSKHSRIYSPWRSEHLDSFLDAHLDRANHGDGSVFTHIAESNDDERNLVLWRGSNCFALMNLYPYNNGHVLLVPYREVARYIDLTADERLELADSIGMIIGWIDRALQPEGYNVGINEGAAAGAGIPNHIHVHIVPRWAGDTNFMPTVGDVKVIPQAIEDSYRRILAEVSPNSDAPPA